MEQRDYLTREIEKIGVILGAILAFMAGLKKGNISTRGVEYASETLKGELDLDLDEVISADPDEVIGLLKDKKGFSDDNIEKLADMLFLIARDSAENDTRKNSILERCLILYQYLETTQRAYSFDRFLRIEEISGLLKVG